MPIGLGRNNQMVEDAAQWYVVHSDARHADCAKSAMENVLHYEVYYPKMRIMKPLPQRKVSIKQRNANVGVPVFMPMFLGYMFVLFDLSGSRWHELFDLFGVRGILLNRGLPAPIRTEIVEAIKSLEVDGSIPIETPLKRLFFKIGQHVRISEGPFTGFDGTVCDLDESHQKVLLDILVFGSWRSVAFESTHLAVRSH